MNTSYNGYNVSVIMNTFNENKIHLFQAIRSYLKQNNVKVQLILSTIEDDPSISYVTKEFKNSVEICISSKEEHPGKGICGIYYQLNKATSLIKNTWFCYASSNDVALPNKLITEINYCIKNNKDVCYSNYYKTDMNLNGNIKTNFPLFNYNLLLKGNFISDCSLIKTELLKKFLPFDDKYYNCGYWNLWLRIYSKIGNVFVLNPNAVFLYRIEHKSTHILRKKDIEKQKIYANAKKMMVITHLKNLKK